MIFACDQCEFRTTVEFNLVFHKEAKYDGIRYLCHLCDYIFQSQAYLKMHLDANHINVNHACDLCVFQENTKAII